MKNNCDIRMVDKIHIVPISSVKPYENNARLNDNAVPALMKSIQKFGFVDPIVITKDGVIVCGHTRVKAATKLGMKEVPAVYAEGLTDEEINALRLADNKVAEIAMWDMEKLEEELANVGDIDMSSFGFDLGSIESEGKEEEISEELEKAAESGESPVSRRGEVYMLGRHRLMCGDSTSEEDWDLLMDGERADMAFTDPPYGVSIGTKNKMLNSHPGGKNGNNSRNRIEQNIENDTLTPEQLRELLVPAMTNLRLNCKDEASYFVTSPQGGELFSIILDVMKESGLPVRHIIIWVKNNSTFSLGRFDYDYRHEPIMYTWTKSHRNYRKGKYRDSIWEFDKPMSSRLHPTMKPVELVENAILDGSDKGMLVADAFGGSGTTIIAAEKTGRSARVMELDPHYCDVIRRRWAEFVGKGTDWESATPAIVRATH